MRKMTCLSLQLRFTDKTAIQFVLEAEKEEEQKDECLINYTLIGKVIRWIVYILKETLFNVNIIILVRTVFIFFVNKENQDPNNKIESKDICIGQSQPNIVLNLSVKRGLRSNKGRDDALRKRLWVDLSFQNPSKQSANIVRVQWSGKVWVLGDQRTCCRGNKCRLDSAHNPRAPHCLSLNTLNTEQSAK